MPTLRILAIYAHPDDELSAGGTLATYARRDADITLICATRGEAATIYCEDCATRETLPAVRTGELECACRMLGIQHLEWLDWPDGGVQTIPLAEATARLVSAIRRLRPHILFTHPDHGGYPHPDHLGVYERVSAAFSAASDPDYRPDLGSAWATPKLYTRAIPESAFDLIPGFREYRVQLNGQALPFVPEPSENIHCVIDCSDTIEARGAAWECHRSQHNPDGMFSSVPEGLQRELYRFEHFRLLAHNLPGELPLHDDLMAGLGEYLDA